MADYSGNFRSNWVKVKPDQVENFKTFFAGLNECQVNEENGQFMVMDTENDIPFTKENGEGEQEEVDWGPLAAMLEKDQVFHMTGIGQEKMRYLEGVGFFVMATGETVLVNINEPPPIVKKFLKKHKRRW